MNKYISHFLTFLLGAVIAGVFVWLLITKYAGLFLIETQYTNQKINLSLLNQIREGKSENTIRMLESLTCTYFDPSSETSVRELQEATKEYFSKYYPQGNSPCSYFSEKVTN